MYKFICILILSIIQFLPCSAQQYFWVAYTQKSTSLDKAPFFFSEKAIQNREKQHLVWDATDLPIDTDIVAWSEQQGEVLVHSRWLNASLIYSFKNLLEIALPKKVKHVTIYTPKLNSQTASTIETNQNPTTALAQYQTNSLQGDSLFNRGFTGQGIRIAVFDVGFNGVENHIAFQHLYAKGKMIKAKDFIRNKEGKTTGGSHGTSVLSCIAGYFGEQRTGLASDAEFLLARTEHNNREPAAEEAYWLAAAEWADTQGANIISSSLGYTYHRYLPSDMDGKTSLVARAATMASKKGILVVNAMGNDGDNGWHYISTPADADSVLSVGGIDPFTNSHISFSSYGPNNVGQLKPNVSAAGYAVCAKPNGGYAHMYGTSFATPLISGLAACVWQQHPEFTNMQLKAFLESKGHLAPYFDYAVGYGVPQVFYSKKGDKPHYRLDENELRVSRQETGIKPGFYANVNKSDALYVSVNDDSGKLTYYYTYHLTDPTTSIYLPELPTKGKLKLFYKGNYEIISLP
ncbi:MAG: serine protease AprX [Flavobacteriales bacterium]|jgi:serine protease AprX